MALRVFNFRQVASNIYWGVTFYVPSVITVITEPVLDHGLLTETIRVRVGSTLHCLRDIALNSNDATKRQHGIHLVPCERANRLSLNSYLQVDWYHHQSLFSKCKTQTFISGDLNTRLNRSRYLTKQGKFVKNCYTGCIHLVICQHCFDACPVHLLCRVSKLYIHEGASTRYTVSIRYYTAGCRCCLKSPGGEVLVVASSMKVLYPRLILEDFHREAATLRWWLHLLLPVTGTVVQKVENCCQHG